MAATKRIVCLANSRKISGRCVAGREWDGKAAGAWVRPISSREHEEISEKEREYKDGSDPKVLDVIDIPLMRSRARTFQSENWLIDDRYYWEKAGRVSWTQLGTLVDAAGTLWSNGYSTKQGRNDRVPSVIATKLKDSLRLIRVRSLELVTYAPGESRGINRRRVQGKFQYGGVEYALRVTDPIVERTYLAQPDGEHRLGECYLTVSLGEEFKGFCYKLIAAVITK